MSSTSQGGGKDDLNRTYSDAELHASVMGSTALGSTHHNLGTNALQSSPAKSRSPFAAAPNPMALVSETFLIHDRFTRYEVG